MNFELKSLGLGAACKEKSDLLVVLVAESFEAADDALSGVIAHAIKGNAARTLEEPSFSSGNPDGPVTAVDDDFVQRQAEGQDRVHRRGFCGDRVGVQSDPRTNG